jgi:hypothetical protein
VWVVCGWCVCVVCGVWCVCVVWVYMYESYSENKFRLRILPLQRCVQDAAHVCRVCWYCGKARTEFADIRMYVYIHTDIHIYIHTYIHTHMHIYIHNSYIHSTHTYEHTYIHMYARMYVLWIYEICMYVWICAHTHTHTHKVTHWRL